MKQHCTRSGLVEPPKDSWKEEKERVERIDLEQQKSVHIFKRSHVEKSKGKTQIYPSIFAVKNIIFVFYMR